MIEKVVSGGQTGVDRAALDVAIAAGIACGGWCPRGRIAEDGPIPDFYPLKETKRRGYIERTRLNVEESDGTLIITEGAPAGGTERALEHAERIGKPVLIVELGDELGGAGADLARARDWVAENGIRVVNIAGPRESTSGGIYDLAAAFLQRLLTDFRPRRATRSAPGG